VESGTVVYLVVEMNEAKALFSSKSLAEEFVGDCPLWIKPMIVDENAALVPLRQYGFFFNAVEEIVQITEYPVFVDSELTIFIQEFGESGYAKYLVSDIVSSSQEKALKIALNVLDLYHKHACGWKDHVEGELNPEQAFGNSSPVFCLGL
jgi:hypothetical protein